MRLSIFWTLAAIFFLGILLVRCSAEEPDGIDLSSLTFQPPQYLEPTETSAPAQSAGEVIDSVTRPSELPKPGATATMTLDPNLGGISGRLSFPSGVLPPMRVIAFRVGAKEWYVTESLSSNTYQIVGLPPGKYHVVAYLLQEPVLAGGYSEAVLCGLYFGCDDHSLVEVEVRAGRLTNGIDPADWYAPAGTFGKDPTLQ